MAFSSLNLGKSGVAFTKDVWKMIQSSVCSERQSLEENPPSAEGSPSPQDIEKRRSRSRNRSRSRFHSFRRSRSYSRSSQSYSPRRSYSPLYSSRHSYVVDPYYKHGGSKGSYSRYNRFPMSSHRRHIENRENPAPSRCLGVFGLTHYRQESALREMFGKYGPVEYVQNVYDMQSGRFRGFAFVYFEDIDDAISAKDRCNGQELDGRKIRVDFSLPKKAHKPSPGIYMGKPTYSKFGGGRRDRGYRAHLPSPYYGKRRCSNRWLSKVFGKGYK